MSVAKLQQEIGWIGFSVAQVREVSFLCSWTRLLACNLANYATRDDHPHYPGIVVSAKRIAGATNNDLPRTCNDVLNPPIRDNALDIDPAMMALQAVCASGMAGVTDRNRTRKPAAASELIWALLVGNGSVNECLAVSLSRAAWQRHLFSAAVTLANHGVGCTNG